MAISRPRAPRSRAAQHEDPDAKLPPIVELSAEEAWEFYVRCARELLGATPEEFERRWAAGEYEYSDNHSDAVGVWLIRASKPAD